MKKYLVTTLLCLPLLIPHFAHADITTGLVGYWPMDLPNGLLDTSGSSVNLTNNGAVTFTTGYIKQAGTFVAAGSRYLSATNPSPLFLPTAFTTTAWIKLNTLPTSSGIRMSILSKFANGNTGYEMDVDSITNDLRGLISIQAGTNITKLASTFGALSTGQWYFVCMTWDGANMKVSVNNGAQDSVAATPSTMASNSNDFNIGTRPGGGGVFMDGQIDEARIYNRVLTASDITQLYQFNGKPVLQRFVVRVQRFIARLGRRLLVN